MSIALKRVYEPRRPEDGARILVDRLWPRGIKKRTAHIDSWLRELAPTTTLRQWFGHRPERWSQFRRRYADELREHPAELRDLRQLARSRRVTLVYAARDTERNAAVVLLNVLRNVSLRAPKPGHRDSNGREQTSVAHRTYQKRGSAKAVARHQSH